MARASPEVVRFTDRALGNDAYLLIAGETAVAVDPARDVRRYLERVEESDARIVAAVETHLHADFVSGARQLAARGADVYASAAGGLAFPHHPVDDGEQLGLDGVVLEAMATPGHTPEHLAYLVEGTDPPILFSGGALIPGGAARTDLLSDDLTEELARALYRTLHERLSALPDETVIHPTHGGGSLCSTGAASGERSTTLGFERKHNLLLLAHTEAEFVDVLLSGYGLYPPYFLRLREVNRRGPTVIDSPVSPPRLEPDEVERELAAGAWAVDIREPDGYAQGHLRGSVSVTVSGSFAVWLGWVIPWGTRMVLVAEDEASARKATTKAMGIGFEDIAGWTPFESIREGGLPVASTGWVDVDEVERRLDGADRPTLLDVRRPEEVAEEGKIPGAVAVEFGALGQGIPPDLKRGPIVTYCASGQRAAVAASLLERAGVEGLAIFEGGVPEWRASGRAVER